MDSCQLVAFISTLACCIAKDKSSDELESLATILTQLGDTLTTIAFNNGIINKK